MSSKNFQRGLSDKFGVPTAAALDVDRLGRLVAIFMNSFGWKPKPGKAGADSDYQLAALRHRVNGLAGRLIDGKERLSGLCLKICGVDRVEWRHDQPKLKRLLAVLGNYCRQEAPGDPAPRG